MKRVLVSACLLGLSCRYDGKSKRADGIERLCEVAQIVPFCPEIYGGLPTPRVPAERVGERVMTRDGRDVTAAYRKGAEEALRLARDLGISCALLKERSPSCGSGAVYDGSFSGTTAAGDGVTAQLFKENGVPVYGETQIDALIEKLKEG